MNQDHVNMIMLALLALNTIMLIYCCVKSSSEEFARDTKRSSAIKSGVATTQAPVKTAAPATPSPAKAAAPTAAAKAPGWAVGIPPRSRSGRSPT
jgi:hypothetical protein